jgi:hypothetical protein
MVDLKYSPIKHNQIKFLRKARARKGFVEVYDALALVYKIINQTLALRTSPRNRKALHFEGT